MTFFWWLPIIASFLLSFVGLVYPVIPGVLLLWGGIALYHFFIDATSLSWLIWSTLVIFTILLFATDQIANLYFVKRRGGSPSGLRASSIGVIIGCFILPPLGIVVVPFILVLLVELTQRKTWEEALSVAFATLVAFLSGTFAKALIHSAIIMVFFLDILR